MKRDRLKCLSISHIDSFLAIGYTIIVGLYDELISLLAYFFQYLQPTVMKVDIFVNHPVLKAWMDRVRDRLNPVWDECTKDFLATKEK